MKELKEYFTGRGEVKGYIFNQIKKNELGYIYEVKGHNIHYEVFKKKINTLYDCVSYPTSKAFGKWAWSVGSFERANEILNSFKTS